MSLRPLTDTDLVPFLGHASIDSSSSIHLVRLRGRVTTGRVREGFDGLGSRTGCYGNNGYVF